jgi:hypothetical protein
MEDDLISEIRDRLWKAEDEVKRLREQIVNYGYADDRQLANRLAEALRSRLAFGYLPGDEEANAAIAAWKESRN